MLNRCQNKRSFKSAMILLFVSLALFMEALDTTIINTAIPVMSVSLQVNPIDLKIALISYLLVLAIFIPISGWIADKFGMKRIFISAIFIFILSSFWCGLTNQLLLLVIARSLQGLGGALMLPIGRLIILRTFARQEVMGAMAYVAIVGALGTMLGPVLGGFIAHYYTWRWIFWINVPVGLLAMLLAWYWLVDGPSQKVPPLDILGFILFGGSLAAFTFGLSAFSESTLSNTTGLLIIGNALLLFLCYIWHSRRRRYPIVNTQLLRIRAFRISVLGNLFSRVGFGGVPFVVPLLLQIGLHYPAQIAGLLLTPIALGVMIIRPVTVKLLRWFGYKKLLIGNTLLLGVSISAFYFVTKQTPLSAIAGMTLLFGICISLQYSGMNSLGYSEIEQADLSQASSIISTLQQLAQSFGVAIAAIFIEYFAGNKIGSSLTVDIFHNTFVVMGCITWLSAVIFLGLKKGDGGKMIG